MKYVKFLIALAIALCIAWTIHTYVLTVYTVTDNSLAPEIHQGNRVIANKLSSVKPQKGDFIVYSDALHTYLGKVVNIPGDTIQLDSVLYQIPLQCCTLCRCPQCQPYLLKSSQGLQLVYKHQIKGKAYPLF